MNRRIILGISLGALIIIMSVILFIFKGSIFTQEIMIEYPDGCIEKYINGELVSDMCYGGRIVLEEEEEEIVPVVGEIQWENQIEINNSIN